MIKICTYWAYDTAIYDPHPPPPMPMKGPALPHLGVILPVSGNYVFSFLRNLNTNGHLLIAFNCNGKSFFVSGKWILEQFNFKLANIQSARQDSTV